MGPRPIVLITGGVAGGKSSYACRRVAALGPRVLFVATCVVEDDEMRAKVWRHRSARPSGWVTVETARDVASALRPGFDAAVVDCLTMLISRQLVDGVPDDGILSEIDRLLDPPPCPLFIVTNEVGWGIVPENALARRFRELQGRANVRAAERADTVVLMVAGQPVPVKGTP